MSEPSVEREIGIGVFRDDQLERRVLLGGRFVGIVFPSDEPVVAGDDAGGWFLVIPTDLHDTFLTHAAAGVYTPGGGTEAQVRNVTAGVDMLSTPITIDSGDNTSYQAATDPVINVANSQVSRGDIIVVDLDDVNGEEGYDIILAFDY